MNTGEEYDATDRLTQLPDSIIHHILSFLDTKSSVRTSMLSRPWKSAWKHVSVLNLHEQSFQNFPSFSIFLDKISSLRCHEINLRKISYYHHSYSRWDRDRIELVIKYAAAHGAEASISNEYFMSSTYLWPRWTRSSSNCRNLKALTMSRVCLNDSDLGLRFSMLTSLKMYDIRFETTYPFREFPCLKDLVVHNFWVDGCFSLKVSGPQLLSLDLRAENDKRVLEIEMDAPKLESFTFDFRYVQLPLFGEMSVPSLARGDFYLNFRRFKPEDFMAIVRLFQCVRSIAVNSRIIWDLDRENHLNFDDDRVVELIANRIHEVASKP